MVEFEFRAFREAEAALGGVYHPAILKSRVMGKVTFDGQRFIHSAFDKREVAFFDGVRGELGAQVRKRILCASEDYKAGCIGVEPVQGAGHEGSIAKRGAFREPCDKGICESEQFGARERMGRNAAGFVASDDGVILIDYIQWDIMIGSDNIIG